MVRLKSIPLSKAIPAGKHIQLLSIDVDAEMMSSLGCVYYAVNGKEQELGIRVDTSKRVAFDGPDNPAYQKEMDTAINRLFKFLSTPQALKLLKKSRTTIIGRHVERTPMPTAAFAD